MKPPLNRVLAALIVALVGADWGTKFLITNQMALGETIELVNGLLYLVHRNNTGVAFSLLADLPEIVRVPLLSIFSLIGIVVFAGVIRSSTDHWAKIAAAFVIAGAIGNMGERVFLGGVTDFVYFSFFPFVFNLADAAITLGGAALAIRLIREPTVPPVDAEPA